MINRLDAASPDFEAKLARLLAWSAEQDSNIEKAVAGILADVRARGDEALLDYTRRFDRLNVSEAAGLRLSAADLQAALDGLGAEQRAALELAAERIRRYHEHQRSPSWSYTEVDGTRLGQRVLPIDRVGLYVPGGKAAYPSSVLMNAIPARVAGVRNLVMVVPTPDGVRNQEVLAAACLAGVDEVYTIGGAQAVAALAYGTAMIQPVDKIVGPGNAYVAEAKRRVFGTVGIDMIAGPSEILVVGDGSVPADWVAMDLFSQAEHDEMAQAILISPDAAYLDAVAASIARQLPAQPRQAVIAKSLADRGALIKVASMAEAAELVNRVAPEHLELAVADAGPLLADIRHAGAIFIGAWGSESLGDYCAGPSHVLPTMRTPRFSSPLGVYDFQKRSSLIEPSFEGADRLGRSVAVLARAEGLEAHARSAEYRLGERESIVRSWPDHQVVDQMSAAETGETAEAPGHVASQPSGSGAVSSATRALSRADEMLGSGSARVAGAQPAAGGRSALTSAQMSAQVLVANRVRPDVQQMAAYVVQNPAGGIKLDAMENPHDFPADLQAALGEHLARQAINRYPSPEVYERLKTAIRDHDGLAADQSVVLGNGSDELIAMLCMMMAQPGAVVMAPAPSFVMYQVSAQLNGMSFVPVSLKADFSLDREAVLDAIVRHKPSLIFLAYPNNPTGNRFDDADIEAILRASDGLVVVDEAYAPFAGGASWMSRVAEWPNLAVMRTCSKWGLAGARIGYLVADAAWAGELDKIRPPYNISVLDAETALFALAHWPQFKAQTEAITTERASLQRELAALLEPQGLAEVFGSETNFVLVRVAGGAAATLGARVGHEAAATNDAREGQDAVVSADTCRTHEAVVARAAQVAADMRAGGVLIKEVSKMHPMLAGCLRLTVGTPEENRAMVAALTQALKRVPVA